MLKKLLCSSCGSNEFENKDGITVCKYCGTQYISELTEEQIRIKEEVKRIIKSADMSLMVQDWKRAETHYDKIMDLDPSNIEMIFFMAYCRLRESMQVQDDPLNRKNIANVMMNSFEMVKRNYDYSTEDSVISVEKFGKYVKDMREAEFIYLVKTDRYGFEESSNEDETQIVLVQIIMKFVLMIEEIIAHYNVNEKTIAFIKRLNSISFGLIADADMQELIPLNNDDLVERSEKLQKHITERKKVLDSDGDIVSKFKDFENKKEKVSLDAGEFNIENSNITWYQIVIAIVLIYWFFIR
ncbi:MAG: TFIIB-type zinc finger domain-containing protein [Acidaminococcaceae bacterium]|nr:TFIIB-type zinc finger domain-containing protein [Acidaminococcaceae bacterium]